ncbi:septum formation family protein [Phytohabitans sp. ZYX-F-186]|uniref:Septum formation family protein n=1 Tax=Phytohabitans maris TaxID=3071409 RepID=A0ABU0ZIT7_9ACTN|nr:septum formation family protein [Phytohabitans sp. ZYX-F-186]MDQ7906959.1 septum formation family protein [Phytohabitans sp. ZYX-F-186]
MRRWIAAIALGGATALLLSACSNPAGVDGDLTDDWAAVPEPKPFVPPAEVCHSGDFAEVAYLSSFNPVDCASPHRLETVYVGQFTGAAASASAPPAKGSPEIRTAFAECDAKTKEYLGADWRTARLWMGVVLPSPQAWAGGSRWFRCDVTEVTNAEDSGYTTSRSGSVKGALKSASPLSLGCFQVTLARDSSIDTMPATACTKDHNSEFAGVYSAPDGSYPSKSADWDKMHNECRKVIAKFAGVPNDGNLKYRTGVVSLPANDDDWTNGNRGVRCYLWLSERKVNRSLKGAGPNGLPIQYAR